jgi:azurin
MGGQYVPAPYGGGYNRGGVYGYGGGGFGLPFIVPMFGFGGGMFGLLLLMAVVGMVVNAIRGAASSSDPGGDLDDQAPLQSTGPVSLAQVQVGLLPAAKQLQADLRRLATTADTNAAAADGLKAGAANEYVKPGDARVLAFTKMIGGGETTSVNLDVAKLKAGTEYTYFCSFPGHSFIMRGVLKLGS